MDKKEEYVWKKLYEFIDYFETLKKEPELIRFNKIVKYFDDNLPEQYNAFMFDIYRTTEIIKLQKIAQKKPENTRFFNLILGMILDIRGLPVYIQYKGATP